LTSATEEVVVDPAVPTDRALQDHPALAALGVAVRTPEQSLQLMMMGAMAHAGRCVTVDDALHFVKELLTDKRGVSSGKLLALVRYNSGVVAVPQHLSNLCR